MRVSLLIHRVELWHHVIILDNILHSLHIDLRKILCDGGDVHLFRCGRGAHFVETHKRNGGRNKTATSVLGTTREARKTSIIQPRAVFSAYTCYDPGMLDVAGFTIIVDPRDNAWHPVISAEGGTVTLQVPENAQFVHPVRVQWDCSASDHQGTALRVRAGRSARVVLVEELLTPSPLPPSQGERGARHSVEVLVGEGAQVE